ncbi:efflux transporter outer membrane subunit [Sinorhizobium meliloti]|uniref:efflux transporter outer membrane subunit n=1 Tax=Rhizobium meliloti TaxID=382 RepID=UPI003F18544A
MRHTFVLVGAACLLGGCTTVGPDYKTPDLSLADTYAASAPKGAAITPESRWWEGLSDSTLNRLIAAAQYSNLTVAQAIERLREARANAKATGAEGLPDLDASGAVESAQTNAGSSSTTDTAELSAGWEVDLFGKYRRNREAARATLEATQEDLNAARLTLLGDVAIAYVDARGYENRLSVARRALAAQREAVEMTRAQLQTGNATALDLSQAEGDAAATEANIPQLETSFHESVNRIATLLDLPVANVRFQFAKGGRVPSPKGSVSRGVPAELLRRRPDIRSAERSLAAAVADIGVSTADLYPSLTLSGSITISTERIAGVSNGSSGWALGPSLTIPVFDAGRRRALVEVERSQASRQYLVYRESVVNAFEEVENAIVSYTRAKRRQAALERSVAAYRRAVDQSRELYEAGAGTVLDFLDARDDLNSAEDTLVQSKVAIAKAYITLCKALGGGWTGVMLTTPIRGA